MPDRYLGIDLGASTIHVVVLSGRSGRAVTEARTFDAADTDGVVSLAAGAAVAAIDAPAELSVACHRDDQSISTKFRTARCGEIALGQQARIWVPWVTPADAGKVPRWMEVGFELWRALREAGHEPLEVYPAGVFRTLAGEALPKKTTRAGLRARIDLLGAHVELPDSVEMWSHDGIDALGAAVTARQKGEGAARPIGHDAAGCDGSAIWLPAAAGPLTNDGSLGLLPDAGATGVRMTEAPDNPRIEGKEPVFRHLDDPDVTWQQVKRQRNRDGSESSVWEKWLAFSPDPQYLSLYARYDPGMMVRRHGHYSPHVLFVIEGEIVCGERSCPAGTHIELPFGAAFGPFRAGPEGATLFEVMMGDPRSWGDRPEVFESLLATHGAEPLPDVELEYPPWLEDLRSHWVGAARAEPDDS